ncbi:hypothetical protein BASA50_003408 [Batrachochytrium salamandrivorans]|uniref:Peptidase C39-like domain-containing protein n=1 Tax=Batrachochytrium salamandrivorans TaxID=1357716 RepID=A0ABQ8FLQ4_9FUNG|nr:hypothetical protein BASA61_003289 [Batrachochytrium salamandrivorans]KAH6598901.1 hypothetical protein BASA50_003408 [Batrachochytrium salamandrivorans]
MLTIIPHIPQSYNWDCGPACASMVLAGLGSPRSSPSDILALYPQKSIWTVDIAYIFKHYAVKDFTMYTSYIGVNWQNASKQFYRDTIADDLKRVHSLFAKARESHVRIVPLVLAMDDICRFLASNRYAIIILVNLNLLLCRQCRQSKGATSWIKWPFRQLFGNGGVSDKNAANTAHACLGTDNDGGEEGAGSRNDADDSIDTDERQDTRQPLLGGDINKNYGTDSDRPNECKTPPLRSPDRMSLFTIPAALQQFTPHAVLSKVQPQYSRDRQAPRSLSGGGGAAVVTNNSNHPRDTTSTAVSTSNSPSNVSMVSTLSAKFFSSTPSVNLLPPHTGASLFGHTTSSLATGATSKQQLQKTQPSDNTSTSGHGDGSVLQISPTTPTMPAYVPDVTTQAGPSNQTPATAGSSSTLPPSPRVPSGFLGSPLRRGSYTLSPAATPMGIPSTSRRISAPRPCTPSHSPTKNSSGPSPRLSISFTHSNASGGLPSTSSGHPVSAGPTTTMSNPTMVASTHPPPRDPSTYYQKRETRTRQPSHSHASPNAPHTLPSPTPQRTSCLSPCLPLKYNSYSIMYDPKDDFEGHYIVLIGYDAETDLVYYRDPGVSAEMCCSRVDDMDKARMSCGTDCDLIVVKVM